MTTYNFKSTLSLRALAIRQDDLSTDTSNAALSHSTEKSGDDDVLIYQQILADSPVFTIDLVNVANGLNETGIVLSTLWAVCVKNVGLNAISVVGDDVLGGSNIEDLQSNSVYYQDFKNTGRAISTPSHHELQFLCLSGPNAVDVWISGATG